MKHKIAHLLFKEKDVVLMNPKDYIEVQPGIMSPLIVNIKATLKNAILREKIVEELVKEVNPKSICICGIESGGSYYAASIANLLKKPLVLFRKDPKKYGIGDSFVGHLPKKKDEIITIIDDVIAGGWISTKNEKELREKGYKSELITIFNYLPKLFGPISKIKISSLINLNELCDVGIELGKLNEKEVEIIKKECSWSNKHLIMQEKQNINLEAKEKKYSVITNGIIVKDDKILLAQRSNKEKHGPNRWSPPGGKLEERGLTWHALEKTVKREILEETGIKVKDKMHLLVNNTFCHEEDNLQVISIVFLCKHESGKAQPMEDTSKVKWIKKNEINNFNFTHDNVKNYVVKAFDFIENKKW